ncbi:hypothetical protein KEM56_004421 [Ascosphaera pollenicola]|nr:hypothetical protein KEM56_004421 [Ascosphaera pollenicola]
MRPAVLQLSPKVDQNPFSFHAAQQQQQQQQQQHFHQQSQLQQQQQQQYPHAVSRLHAGSFNASSATTSLSPANLVAPGATDIPIDANSHATGFKTSDEVNHAGRFAPPPTYISLPSSLPLSDYSLRRKTPNGTLAAGYDGSPGEGKGAIQPPAPKHIRISNTNGSLARAIGSHRELGRSGPVATGPSQPREYRQGADMHVRNYLAQGAPIGQDHNMPSRQGGIEVSVPSDYQSNTQAQLQAQNQLSLNLFEDPRPDERTTGNHH